MESFKYLAGELSVEAIQHTTMDTVTLVVRNEVGSSWKLTVDATQIGTLVEKIRQALDGLGQAARDADERHRQRYQAAVTETMAAPSSSAAIPFGAIRFEA